MSKEADAQPAAPARSRKLLFIIVAVLVLAGGGGGAYWKFFAKGPEAAAAAEPAKPPAILHFDPFVVNLADAGTPRFLRITIGLVVDGEEAAAEFAEDAITRARVRSSLIEMLSQQQASALITPEGKAALKQAVLERTEHSAEALKVHDVLFTEFIVQ